MCSKDTTGKRIKRLREQKKLTQKALSQAIDCDLRTISRYENGKSSPQKTLSKRMARFFGVPISYISGQDLKDEFSYRKKVYQDSQEFNQLYRNEFHEDEGYYWIQVFFDNEQFQCKAIDDWKEFTNSTSRLIPGTQIAAAREYCMQKYETPVILNNVSEISLLYTFCGHAMIKQNIYDHLLEDFIN